MLTAVCHVCQPTGPELEYVNPSAYRMSIHYVALKFMRLNADVQSNMSIFEMVLCGVCCSLAAVPLSTLESILDYLLGFHGDPDNTLMQICLSLGTGQLVHGGKYIL